MKVLENKVINYSSRDYEGFRADLIAMLKTKLPEYTDFSESDTGIVILELLAHELDVVSYYNDIVANEVFLSTARERESVSKRALSMGYTLGNATSAKFLQVIEIIPQPVDYVIPKGTRISTKSDGIEPEVPFETDRDLIIPANSTGAEVDEFGDYILTVPISQGKTVYSEVLGSSVGTKDQKFYLSYSPVIEDSLEVLVNEGTGSFRWNRVNSFIDSDFDKTDYTFSVNEQEEANIQFGNGLSGRIPSTFTNGISATYKIGGGNLGNVAPNTITEFISKPAIVVRTFNPTVAYEKGLDKESLESARVKVPAFLRTLHRAVTLQDFKDLALTQKYVRKANAIKNNELYCVDICVQAENTTFLSDYDKDRLEEFFEARVLLGVDFRVLSVEYTEVPITLVVRATPEVYNSTIQANIESALTTYFEYGNRDFAEEVVISDIYSICKLQGVKSVSVVAPIADVVISPYHIPKLGAVNVNVTGGRV